jgi:hypothetical protein
MDALTEVLVDRKSYSRQLRRAGLVWGAPYAVALIVGAATVLACSVLNARASTLLLGIAAAVVGVRISLFATTRSHEAANRRAESRRDQVDPLKLLERRVAELRGCQADWKLSGEVQRLIRWLQDPFPLLPPNDRRAAARLSDLLAGPDTVAKERYSRIYALAEELSQCETPEGGAAGQLSHAQIDRVTALAKELRSHFAASP